MHSSQQLLQLARRQIVHNLKNKRADKNQTEQFQEKIQNLLITLLLLHEEY